ncbi:acyltransferase [Aeromonas rivipollensis]|uniref:acyltransferase n=1 Tax=Aeromonas rivipollensis TaxID=948519 RepID=UPI0013D798E6|nr:acyltransferase [Aeromonas rivipollensis]NEX80897.1 acyltransferase [Aeromonas rivipollensis]
MKAIWLLRALLLKPFMSEFGVFSYIGRPIFLSGLKFFHLGKKVRIYPNARIEAFKKSQFIIEDDVSIGQNLHLICANEVKICTGTTISANVFISDVDHTFDDINIHVMQQPLKIAKTYIGSNSFIGYGAVILPGTQLGASCVVGANSVVKGVFGDYCMLAGSPAKIIKRYHIEEKCWKRTDTEGNFL